MINRGETPYYLRAQRAWNPEKSGSVPSFTKGKQDGAIIKIEYGDGAGFFGYGI